MEYTNVELEEGETKEVCCFGVESEEREDAWERSVERNRVDKIH